MTYTLIRWMFFRCLGLIYAFAFVSLLSQIVGLVGKDGITPIALFINAVKINHGPGALPEALMLFPSFAWFNASDAALQGMCIGGIVSSLLVLLGILTGPAILFCWLVWLSLVTIGQDFLCFQWDALLLEAGFLAIFYAPWCLAEPPWCWRRLNYAAQLTPTCPAFVWLYRWLLFRLMFESGLVKIASRDPAWANFTALNYHYLTQPLPTPAAYFAAKLPEWLNRCTVGYVFFMELVVPFLIFFPRRFRLFAFVGLTTFQLLIALTGNYAYFNLLTIALCLFLIDDQVLLKMPQLLKVLPSQIASRLMKSISFSKFMESIKNLQRTSPKLTMQEKIPAAFAAALITVLTFTNFFRVVSVPETLQPLFRLANQCCIFNHYGLFAVMTTKRDEIIVEGSNDGKSWFPYEFRYKPGDLNKPPCGIAPMQPRLDWQMWFAAQGRWEQSPWFTNLMVRLFEGSPSVLELLEKNPFPDSPPHYLRAQLYRYYFSDIGTLIKTGQWWRREYAGAFMPELQVQ